MNILDLMRFTRKSTAALIALSTALLVQTFWFSRQIFHSEAAIADLSRPLIFTGTFLAVAVTRGRHRAVNTLARFVIAGAFLEALLIRFGDFSAFIRYTEVVNSFMPPVTIPVLAVLATIAEVSFCLLMIVGFRLQIAATGSAFLLFLFATAMTISGLEQFTWAVYVLAMGGWMLATVDASMLSLDSLFAGKESEAARQ